jgi:hypothetical protein
VIVVVVLVGISCRNKMVKWEVTNNVTMHCCVLAAGGVPARRVGHRSGGIHYHYHYHWARSHGCGRRDCGRGRGEGCHVGPRPRAWTMGTNHSMRTFTAIETWMFPLTLLSDIVYYNDYDYHHHRYSSYHYHRHYLF